MIFPSKLLHLLIPCTFCLMVFPSCTASDVARRQTGITNAQGDILDRRAERIKARDQRMDASRDVWFQ